MCNLCDLNATQVADALASPDTKPKPARKAKAPANRNPKPKPSRKAQTHEAYVAAIYKLALKQPGLDHADRQAIASIKLTYGAGPDGVRGVTYYNRWQRATAAKKGKPAPAVCFVAICATGQESAVQVCGTTLHELGHVMTGPGVGHGEAWLEACARLGLGGTCVWQHGPGKRSEPAYNFSQLSRIQAAGTAYTWDMFEPTLRAKLQAIPLPTDGSPVAGLGALLGAWGGNARKLRPCGAGYGARGGVSRGSGAGSRMLLWECRCKPKPAKIRHAGTDLDARCNRCSANFKLIESSLPASHSNGGPLAPGSIAAKVPRGKKAKRIRNVVSRKRRKLSRARALANLPIPGIEPGKGEIPF